jgi:hypothetical protein
MVRFDGYSATTTEANHYQLAELFGSGMQAKEGHGFHQFGHRVGFKDETGSEVGAVMWGGRQGNRTMIEVKGERSPEVVERLRSLFPHRCTRMDSAADFDAPESFSRLLRTCMAVKRRHRLKGRREGDWEDFPELGRTQYLGSPQSVAMLRLYEKGRQPEYLHLARPDWVRAEIQVRPAKEAKEHFSTVSAADAWGAAAWSRELAGEILAEHVDPHPAGTTWRLSERDRALAWMCKQYGAHLLSLKEDCGSWETFGLTLGEMLKKDQE